MSDTGPTAFFEDARRRVEDALARLVPTAPDCPPLLAEAMRYALLAGGKRLRPVLTLAAAEAVATHDREAAVTLALPAACAVECLHTYSLVHDDLPAMDDDALRRGRPTLHVVHGDGLAILVGDALQAEAFALLARVPASAPVDIQRRTLQVVARLATAAGAHGMVGGQTTDLTAAGKVPGHTLILDADALQRMHQGKTGALIRAAASAGAIMAGGSPTQIDAVDQWAAAVGLAFQIIDDILDVEGSAETLGKTAGKDAAQQKPTYPALYGIDGSRHLAAEAIQRADDVLAAAALGNTRLAAIGRWVIARHR